MVQSDSINVLRQRAAEDLRAAEILIDSNDELIAPIGFHLQQFIEKKMKVILAEHGIKYPKTHDLSILLELFPHEKISEDDEMFAQIISRFAVESRYEKFSVPPMDGQQMLEKVKRFAELIESLW